MFIQFDSLLTISLNTVHVQNYDILTLSQRIIHQYVFGVLKYHYACSTEEILHQDFLVINSEAFASELMTRKS